MGVTYGADRLVGTTKNKLRQDEDGYYDVIVGAFNVYNSGGDFYSFESAKGHFDGSHDFQRRIKSGSLYGEGAHPACQPGWTKEQFIHRILTIDPLSISHHFKEIRLEEEGEGGFTNEKDGSKCITTYARIKPSVPGLCAAMANPHENVAFSIRSITEDRFDPRRGCKVKEMRAIVTYDWVVEPGIKHARKWDHPGLESLNLEGIEERSFTHKDVVSCIDKLKSMGDIGCEADSLSRLSSLADSIRPKAPSVALAGARKTATYSWG